MNTTRKRLALVPIGLYILSTPFYVLPPAYPQVAHLLMALITIGLLFTVPMPTGPTFRKSVIAFAIFVIYTYIVNGAFSIVTNDYGVLMSSVYFTFNFVSFLSIGKYYDTYGSEFLRFVLIMTAYSLCLQAFFGITGLHPGAKGYRSTLFFNNPNQLGYWTLIASSLVAIGSTRLKINTFSSSSHSLAACTSPRWHSPRRRLSASACCSSSSRSNVPSSSRASSS